MKRIKSSDIRSIRTMDGNVYASYKKWKGHTQVNGYYYSYIKRMGNCYFVKYVYAIGESKKIVKKILFPSGIKEIELNTENYEHKNS